MTLKASYAAFWNELKALYPTNEAANISALAFEHITKIRRSQLITGGEEQLSDELQDQLDECLTRLRTNEPIQYILGECWFYNLKLKVTPAVLIPRPETEELTDMVIRFLKDRPGKNILDIGTGSGCIAIAIRKNNGSAMVTAMDTSKDALLIAAENSNANSVEIKFLHLDFLEEGNWSQLPIFDVVVSNPPYIPWKEKRAMDKHVTDHEPSLALFVDNDRPLVFYEKTALFGKKHLNENGRIFMEIHESFGPAILELFDNIGYEADILNDMQGKQRILVASHRSR